MEPKPKRFTAVAANEKVALHSLKAALQDKTDPLGIVQLEQLPEMTPVHIPNLLLI